MKWCAMSELSAECEVEADGTVTVEIPWVEFLKTQGYRVDAINNVQTVDSGSRDMTHLVAQIQTYDKPFNSAELDLVEDEITVPVCSCEDFTYNQGASVDESMIKPSQSGTCRHLRAAYKAIHAREDENQTELGK